MQVCATDPVKLFKDQLLILGVNANTRISNDEFDHGLGTFDQPPPDFNAPAVRGELDGIIDQVAKGLHQPFLVSLQGWQFFDTVDLQRLFALLQCLGPLFHCLTDKYSRAYWFKVKLQRIHTDGRHVNHGAIDRFQPVGGLADTARYFGQVGAIDILLLNHLSQDVGIATYLSQRRA